MRLTFFPCYGYEDHPHRKEKKHAYSAGQVVRDRDLGSWCLGFGIQGSGFGSGGIEVRM